METSFYDSYAEPAGRRDCYIQLDGRVVNVSNLIASPKVSGSTSTSLYPDLDSMDFECQGKASNRCQALTSDVKAEASGAPEETQLKRSISAAYPPTLPIDALPLNQPSLSRATPGPFPTSQFISDAFARDFPGVKVSVQMMGCQGDIGQISPMAPRLHTIQAYGHSSIPKSRMEEHKYPTTMAVRNNSLRNLSQRPPSMRKLDGRSPSMRGMAALDGRSPSIRAMSGGSNRSLVSPVRVALRSPVRLIASPSPLRKPSPKPHHMINSVTPSPPPIRSRAFRPEGLPFPGETCTAGPDIRPELDRQMSESLLSSSRSLFGRDEWTNEEPNAFTIEVMPGMDLPLRGSFETRNAIRTGAILELECMGCTVALSCMDAAEYVICPCCHTVSPIAGFGAEAREGVFGVALGFTSQTDASMDDDGYIDQQEKDDAPAYFKTTGLSDG